MFFYIGDDCPIKALKQVEPSLYLDEGWNEYLGIWYKGYSTDCVLSDTLISIIDGYKPAGNWCVIYKGFIYHPILRGFPLYQHNNSLTNIQLVGFNIVTYNTPTFALGSLISADEAALLISNILIENTDNFLKYNNCDHLELIVSAGLDTLTCWSLIDKSTNNYTLSAYVTNRTETTLQEGMGCRREYTSDLVEKVSEDYWGYAFLSLKNEFNWSIGGYYAEVMQYRDAAAISAIANYHGKWIDELADEEDYLYWFLKRPAVEAFKNQKLVFHDEYALKLFLFETVFYDFQMWGIDNNLHFSPFYDIRIPYIMARLSVEDLTINAVTGDIQRRIIQKHKPELMDLLSDYKNEKDVWGNFRQNFDEKVHVTEGIKIIYR